MLFVLGLYTIFRGW